MVISGKGGIPQTWLTKRDTHDNFGIPHTLRWKIKGGLLEHPEFSPMISPARNWDTMGIMVYVYIYIYLYLYLILNT